MKYQPIHLFAGAAFLALSCIPPTHGQVNEAERVNLVQTLEQKYTQERLDALARIPTGAPKPNQRALPGPRVESGALQGIQNRIPLIHSTDNENSIISAGATTLVASPINLNGSGFTMGVWDELIEVRDDEQNVIPQGGGILETHASFGGRVRNIDRVSALAWHANHVSGTMAGDRPGASNTDGFARGANIDSYDWDNFIPEIAAAGSSTGTDGRLLVGNFSFGLLSGWTRGYRLPVYFGNLNDNGTAINFGSYSTRSRDIDTACHANPYFLPFFSAGNDRDDNAPFVGQRFWHWVGNGVVEHTYDPNQHPGADHSEGGFDTLGVYPGTKNGIAIGAVNDAVRSGARDLGQATMASFSGWGPTDDGRIKPDLVANGVSLRSAHSDSNNSYADASGTSMSSPSACGVGQLLQDSHDRAFGRVMRASTLKALMIHTADDLGRPGPDYENGWGLVNGRAAHDLIQADKTNPLELIKEDFLVAGTEYVYPVTMQTAGPIRATLAWTDPASGTVTQFDDDATRRLVNDLDMRLRVAGGQGAIPPYILDPANPNATATRGDNFRDNVEQVYSPGVPVGNYEIVITYKGNLTGAQQHFSLVLDSSLSADALPAPKITSRAWRATTYNQPFTHTFQANRRPAQWKLFGNKPHGLIWDADNGVLSGKSIQLGFARMTVRAEYPGSIFVDQRFTIRTRPAQ